MIDYPEIYAVDFDGTLNLAERYPELGEPNRELIKFLREKQKQGDKIILWTCREGELLEAAVMGIVYGINPFILCLPVM